MPDPFLVGNGEWCPACLPAGAPMLEPEQSLRSLCRRGCNHCAGEGRIAFTDERIVERTLAEGRAWRAAGGRPGNPRGR